MVRDRPRALAAWSTGSQQSLLVCPAEQGVEHPVEADGATCLAHHELPLARYLLVPCDLLLQLPERGGCNIVNSVFAAESRSIAMEFYEAHAQREFKGQLGLVVRDGEEVIAQHAIGMGSAQPLESVADALRDAWRQIRMAHGFLLEACRILRIKLPAKPERAKAQCAIVCLAELIKRLEVHRTHQVH